MVISILLSAGMVKVLKTLYAASVVKIKLLKSNALIIKNQIF